MISLDGLHQFAVQTAYQAGIITLGYFNQAIQIDYKLDNSPVTAADKAAENFIRAEIENRFPSHTILGEEFGLKNDLSSTFRWIIDPIDGTKSFMRGVPMYGVLIGLEVEGEIKVGAAYFPGTDEMLSAYEGGGAWINGRRAITSDKADLGQAYVCYTNVLNMEAQSRSREWQALSRKVFTVRGWGDAYGHMLVATGRAEVMLDPIMNVWDCGPFPVILKEANGYFGSWDGREGHLHHEAISCSNTLVRDVLEVFRSA
ncbi:MAG TPA: inositol monophosphatase family protein [Anaerolineales bacterium]|nr:inositol monophosphatase family protein [Anaerolineales bacterium]